MTAPFGIVAALPEEATGLFAEIAASPAAEMVRIGQRDFHVGTLWGRRCVLTLARIGKVAAATTATALIHQFGVEAILFTGVAGAASPSVRVGDIVLADVLLQHDLDASPLFPRYEVPITGVSRFPTDRRLRDRLSAAAASFLAEGMPSVPASARAGFGLEKPSLHHGLVISGDRFVSSLGEIEKLRRELPDALALEMEGAALAQVCHDYAVPFAVLRTVSDSADDTAYVDFPAFMKEVASHYSHEIVRRFLQLPDAAA